jgi:uncharacterized protein (DUF2237 family)
VARVAYGSSALKILLILFSLLLAMRSTGSLSTALNVLGTPLQLCCAAPMTGYFRDGFCHTSSADSGRHTVCAIVTPQFLSFTKSKGNDLETPHPPSFPGLRPGDRWCLCAGRWLEAYKAGAAPGVVLEATNQQALTVVPLEALQEHAVREAAVE